jgi:hypothetical protein
MVGISFMGLMALLIVGACVLAMAVKRPAFIFWAVAGLLGLLLMSTFFYASVRRQPEPSATRWDISQDVPAAVRQALELQSTQIDTGVQFRAASWGIIIKILMIAAIVIGLMILSRALRSHDERRQAYSDGDFAQNRRRRGGWGWAGGLASFLLLFMLGLFWIRATGSVEIAQRRQESARQQFQRQVEQLRHRGEQVKEKASRGLDEMLNEFDKPRIPLNESPSTPSPPAEPNKKLSFEEAKKLIEGDQGAAKTDDENQAEAVQADKPGESTSGAGETPRAAAEAETTAAEKSPRAKNAVAGENRDSVTASPPAELPGMIASASATPAATPPAILRIHFDPKRMRDKGVSFGDVAAAFLNNRHDRQSPVRIDGERLLIEVESTSDASYEFAKMRMDGRGSSIIRLSELTDTITTTTGWSGKSPAGGTRPEWVDDPPQRSGDTWRRVIKAGLYSTPEECYRRADELLYAATWIHLQTLLGRTASLGDEDVLNHPETYAGLRQYLPWYPDELGRIGIGIDFIRREIVPPGSEGEYLETVERPGSSVGPMKQLYTRMEFTPQVNARLKAAWVKYEQGGRAVAAGVASGLALGVVVLVYGLLKVDTWTKGYYSKRLFVGVPALIAAAAVVFALTQIK